MAKLYDALVALPSKSLGILSGAVGIPAAFWPTWFEEKVGAKVNADAIQTGGIILMAASIAYFALLWWLKPDGRSTEAQGNTQTTSGDSSPNVHSGGGPVTINYIGPERAEEGVKKSYNYNLAALTEGLRSVLAEIDKGELVKSQKLVRMNRATVKNTTFKVGEAKTDGTIFDLGDADIEGSTFEVIKHSIPTEEHDDKPH